MTEAQIKELQSKVESLLNGISAYDAQRVLDQARTAVIRNAIVQAKPIAEKEQ